MSFKKFLLVPLFAATAALTGCGNDCVSGCEDRQDCADASAEFKAQDCDDLCDKQETLAEDADCSDQYDDAMSCASDVDDVCKAGDDSCAAENTALFACILPYCSDAAHTAQCAAVGAGGG